MVKPTGTAYVLLCMVLLDPSPLLFVNKRLSLIVHHVYNKKYLFFFCLYIFVTILKPFLPIEVYPCAVLLLWTTDADPNLGYQKTLYAAVVHPCNNYGNPTLDVYTHPIVGFPPFYVRQL